MLVEKDTNKRPFYESEKRIFWSNGQFGSFFYFEENRIDLLWSSAIIWS
jgi:hypothetical protein